MKILLLNDNPVVNKLVTLSAQKTSDELEVVDSIDKIEGGTYDLLVVDDTMYNDDLFNKLQERITFTKSLYICSRDTQDIESFTSTLKKPFLPTDLVELFASLAQGEGDEIQEGIEEQSSAEGKPLEELEPLDDLNNTINLEIDEELEELDEVSFDKRENTESILDDEEAQKVKDLLDETSEELEDLDLEEDAQEEELELSEELELEDEEELELPDDLDLEEDAQEEELELSEELELEDEEELELPDDLDLEEDTQEEELELPEELELEDEEELELPDTENELDLETQIESAVSELSEDDLESEIGLDALDGLTTRDLKLAIGEEIDEELDEEVDETSSEIEEENVEVQDGVEQLKKLLEALSDKNVAASMKGMKISINITLGDNS